MRWAGRPGTWSGSSRTGSIRCASRWATRAWTLTGRSAPSGAAGGGPTGTRTCRSGHAHPQQRVGTPTGRPPSRATSRSGQVRPMPTPRVHTEYPPRGIRRGGRHRARSTQGSRTASRRSLAPARPTGAPPCSAARSPACGTPPSPRPSCCGWPTSETCTGGFAARSAGGRRLHPSAGRAARRCEHGRVAVQLLGQHRPGHPNRTYSCRFSNSR
jgi:hypothetical protein